MGLRPERLASVASWKRPSSGGWFFVEAVYNEVMNISLMLGWYVVVVFRLGRSFVSLASVESFMNSHLVMTHSRLRVIEVKSNLCGESESQLG